MSWHEIRRSRCFRLRVIAVAGIVALAGAGARGEEVDLQGAVRMALEKNQAFQAVAEKRVEVESAITEARADAFPQLSLYAGWSQSRNPAFLNSSDFEDILSQFPGADFAPRAQDLYSGGLRLSQPVFTFGKIGAAVQLAELAASATEAQVEVARLDTALAAAEAYFGLLAAREQVRTLELEQQARAEALAVVQARFDIGEATQLELLQAQAALAEVRPTVESARGGVLVAETRLRAVLGMQAGTSLLVRPVEGDPPLPPGSGALSRTGWQRRPELAALELEREARQRQERVITADGLPRLDLSGSWGRQVRLLENMDRSLFDDWRVSLDLSWSLFDGGRRRGQAAAVRSLQRQLALQLADTENRVALDVEQAVAGYRTALARLDAARQARDVAREARRVAEETYQLGAAIFADVLDAQRREVQAEVNAVASYYDAWVGAARLARATGAVPGLAWDSNGWKQE